MTTSSTPKFKTLLELNDYFSDEYTCKQHLAQLRWKGTPVCPRCGCDKSYLFKSGDYKCAGCRKKFSVRLGTVFQDSPIPLRKWFVAVYLLTSHKKGISSCQLAKDLGVTQKTAWFMLHRVRYAVQMKSFDAKPEQLSGTVEADETYVGGKEKNKHADKRTKGTQGRSTKTKAPVFGMKERNGRVVAIVVESTDSRTLQPLIREHVKVGANLMTDEYRAYVGSNMLYNHQVVKHGEGQYVNGNAHTNGMENFWSQFKRGVFGIYHHVSVKHLQPYVDEYGFRYNFRGMQEGERVDYYAFAGKRTFNIQGFNQMTNTNTDEKELKDQFKIRFSGDQNQIDANTFVNYLIHLNTIIQEVNRELAPERKIRVKINALEKGSFVVGIELQSVLDQVKALFDSSTVDYIASIITIWTGFVSIKETLKGKKAKEVQNNGDSVTIVAENGSSVQVTNITYKIYSTNQIVAQALTKQFETLEQDENIDKVEILNTDNKPLVVVERDKFDDLSQPEEMFNGGVKHEVRKVMLSITKFSFDPKLKSSFIYMNIPISAYIKDKAFYESVDKGKSFAKGDKLEARLQVNMVFDSSIGEDIIRSYEVIEVIRHVSRNDPNQLKLDLTTS